MGDEMNEARQRNREFVAFQREAAGLKPVRRVKPERTEGVARVLVPASQVVGLADEEVGALLDEVVKCLRGDIAEKGGLVSQIARVRLVNCDVEVRAFFSTPTPDAFAGA